MNIRASASISRTQSNKPRAIKDNSVANGRSFRGLTPSEDAVHRAVVAHLATYGDPSAVVWHVPNGGSRHIIEAAKFKALGVRKGMPDLMIYRRGQLHCLELKRDKGGKISRVQLACMKQLTEQGALCAVAKGVDEALAILKDWGLLPRQARM